MTNKHINNTIIINLVSQSVGQLAPADVGNHLEKEHNGFKKYYFENKPSLKKCCDCMFKRTYKSFQA